MRVFVFVKQTAYIYHPLAIDSRGAKVDPEKIVYMLNPYDEVAVEEAVSIKDNFSGSEVILLTAGPPRSDKALRYAFAFGADKMIRINLESSDPWAISLALAQTVKGRDYDIILCGQKAIDTNDNQVGSIVAEILDIAQVSAVTKLEPHPLKRMVIVERKLGRGNREVIECRLPALFCLEAGANDPRYPNLANRLFADKCEIELIEVDQSIFRMEGRELFGDSGVLGPPRPKPKKIFTPGTHLSALERRRLIMSQGADDKRRNVLEGSPEEVAEKIVHVLAEQAIF